ncbi:MAG: UTRA domain-containing protein, partial [Desulfobacterales bacterium]|nr:UTRA domain-containing protein [Desulfobacterales bacterium]
RAVNLNKRIAGLFKLPPKAAGLYMESVTYDDNNIPVEVLCSYCRGDRYVFEVELGKYQIKGEKFHSPNVK